MPRNSSSIRWLMVLGLGLTACSSAHADRIGPEPARHRQTVAAQPAVSPYAIDLIDQNGHGMQVYQHRGRFYVLGTADTRYTIRVSNPTDRRVEAVVSVDGLDVIDGETADLGKRGYIVPAQGELRIDGFRTSTSQVATFRFSAVSNSYAGRKGKARNVGVIGVAIFDEAAQPEIILSGPVGGHGHGHGHHRHRGDNRPSRDIGLDSDSAEAEDDGNDRFDAPAREPAAKKAPSQPPRVTAGSATGRTAESRRPAPPPTATPNKPVDEAGSWDKDFERQELTDTKSEQCCGARPNPRPGLGTEFGESRYSAVSWTRFVRSSNQPSAVTEMRYNDSTGLEALGIRLAPPVSDDEVFTRETASPFPGSRFSTPPR